jgi:hypothetical protein
MDHKALNLAARVFFGSVAEESARLVREAGRSGAGGANVCCHSVVTATARARAPRTTFADVESTIERLERLT